MSAQYAIREFDSAGAPLAVITAAAPVDALAEYSISQGFADPRQFIGTDEDCFFTMPDGTVGMVFTNQQLFADPVVSDG